MRRNTSIILLAVLFALMLIFAGCSKPWNHPDYSGASADKKFKADSLDCQVIAGEEFPLNELKQKRRYKACMTDRGWQHNEDHQGLRFTTKPR